MCDIKAGDEVRVVRLDADCGIRRRFMDLGLVENTQVVCVGHSPLGDPSAYLIRGAVIAIRDEDSRSVKCEYID